MGDLNDVFSRRLSELREAAGMTQTDLGKVLGSGKVQVSRYETGRILPNAETLSRIADSFDCSVDYLLGRTNSPKGQGRTEDDYTPEERRIIETLRRGLYSRTLHLIALVMDSEDESARETNRGEPPTAALRAAPPFKSSGMPLRIHSKKMRSD